MQHARTCNHVTFRESVPIPGRNFVQRQVQFVDMDCDNDRLVVRDTLLLYPTWDSVGGKEEGGGRSEMKRLHRDFRNQ